MTCDCINIQHGGGKCKNTAGKKCTTCNDNLCGACAKNHHVHNTIEKLERGHHVRIR